MIRKLALALILTAYSVTALSDADSGAEAVVQTVRIAAISESIAALPKAGFVSTAQPDEAALRHAAAAGYVAVIDLRGEQEDRGIDEEAVVSGLGMDYVALPVSGPKDMTFANAKEFAATLAKYDGGVLMHCASGNRVGALVALHAWKSGASIDDAMAVGKTAGLSRSEEHIRKKLQAESPL